MCRHITRTYLLCLHTTTTTESCRIIISFLRPRCTPINSDIFMNDFCPPCANFWDQYSVSTKYRRQRIADFRVGSDYRGSVTPGAVPTGDHDGFFFGFIIDSEQPEASEWQAGAETGYVSELNARWEVCEFASISKIKRAASISSTETIWPSADVGSKRLGLDEFGYDEDGNGEWEGENGLIDPDEFEMENLERALCAEDDDRLKPVQPMPSVAPQRRVSDVDYSKIRK